MWEKSRAQTRPHCFDKYRLHKSSALFIEDETQLAFDNFPALRNIARPVSVKAVPSYGSSVSRVATEDAYTMLGPRILYSKGVAFRNENLQNQNGKQELTTSICGINHSSRSTTPILAGSSLPFFLQSSMTSDEIASF